LYADFQSKEAKKEPVGPPKLQETMLYDTVFKGLVSVGISASIIKKWKEAWALPVATGEPLSVGQISKI
jgi:hypothetical protein